MCVAPGLTDRVHAGERPAKREKSHTVGATHPSGRQDDAQPALPIQSLAGWQEKGGNASQFYVAALF